MLSRDLMDEVRGWTCALLAIGLMFFVSPAWAGQAYLGEAEPNGTSATASPIAGTNVVVRGNRSTTGRSDTPSPRRPAPW